MHPEKILLPIDIRRCPVDVLSFANGTAARSGCPIILLHAIKLNIVPVEQRIIKELADEAQTYLKHVAREYLPDQNGHIVRVRFGNPAEEILSEAEDQDVDLIIVPNHGPSLWKRLMFVWKRSYNPLASTLVERVVRAAKCSVVVAAATNCFDCERRWGRRPLEWPGGRSSEALRAQSSL